MERKSALIQLAFLIVVLLAFGLAFLRISDRGIGTSVSPARASYKRSGGVRLSPDAARRTLESLKREEFLGVSPSAEEEYASFSGRGGGPSFPGYSRGARVSDASSAGSGGGQNGFYSSYGRTAGASSPSGRVSAAYARHAGREGAGGAVNHGSRERGNLYASGGAPLPNTAGWSGKRGGEAAPGVYRPSAGKRAQGMFSPYLTSLTQEQSESLKKQLTGLSSRVERAVLQALLPKSRKDANIEKYLQRNSSYSADAGPFGGVMKQMSAQKAGIMNSMNGAFGKDAADEAGKIMDAYQKELIAALSQPGQTQEQLAQKARDIGQKYEKELQALGEKHAFKDFRNQREQEDGKFASHLAKAYGPELSAQMQDVLNAYREKDMQLALAGLPQEEYYKRYLENQRARRKELEDLAIKDGKSLQPLRDAEDEKERDRVKNALKDEAEGKTLPKEHRFDEKTIEAYANDLRQEHHEKLELAQRIYGDEGSAEINAIYERHAIRMNEVMNSNLPFSEKQDKIKDIRQQTNAEIAAFQKTPKMREAREKGQVESTMAQLMQDPGVANASPEEKAAFESYARPVLQDMFHRINEVSESNLPEDEKQRRIAALQERAQRQLSGGK